MQELIRQISDKLEITQEQAKAGAGIIIGFIRNHVGDEIFAKVSEKTPGLDSLIEASAKSHNSGGFLGAVAGLVGGMTGGGSFSELISGAGKLSGIGVSPAKMEPLAEMVISYLRSKTDNTALDDLSASLPQMIAKAA